MTEPRFATRKAAREHGWFSRRHETDEANREARETFRTERGVAGRRLRAYARGADRPKEKS